MVRCVWKLGGWPKMAWSFLSNFCLLKGKDEEIIQLDVKFLKFNQYPPQKLQSSSVTLGYHLFAKDVQLGGGEMDRPDWHQWRSRPSQDLAPRIGEINSKMPCPKPPNTSPVLKTGELNLDEHETPACIYIYIDKDVYKYHLYENDRHIDNDTVVLSILLIWLRFLWRPEFKHVQTSQLLQDVLHQLAQT